ncbi:hypothetical protein DFJ74DRAFT_694665 [Hyaloraphidium curvatum]|nr:hypothetical protein DFJ74DRAFT_694665 [Hyaloraphidium curvatum]
MLLRFLSIAVLHAVAILLFASGFLLSRTALTDRSECGAHDGTGGAACPADPPFKRLVLIVIDGWRYDFGRPEADVSSSAEGNACSFFRGKMERLAGLLRDRPLHTFLARFRADPPTTTLQRLKALVTGSLPTFVEAGSNFGGTAVEEDNLLYQLVTGQGKELVFMGDDTWMGLFPSELSPNASYPYPSLNVWDLDTVDEGCQKHLFPTLRGERGAWDILVAHFLGVDHAGHRYGPAHPEMERKLREMDDVIAETAALLADGDLLVVLGDHGMDSKGDHGGDSALEVDAGVFAYSPQGFVASMDEKRRLELFAEKLASAKLDGNSGQDPYDALCAGLCRTVAQIDLVPSLALLMGVPIPFQNLGSIVPELVWSRHTVPYQRKLAQLVDVHEANARQILTYLEKYAEVSPRDLPASQLAALQSLFRQGESAHRTSKDSDDRAEDAAIAYLRFTRGSLQVLRELWAHFDVTIMAAGVVVLLAAMFAAVPATEFLPETLVIAGLRGGLVGFLVVRGLVGLSSAMANRPLSHWNLATQAAVGGFAGSALGVAIEAVFVYGFRRLSSLRVRNVVDSIPLVLPLIQAASMGSVQYVIWEDYYTFRLALLGLVLVAWFSWYRSANSTSFRSTLAHLAVCTALIVVSSHSTVCREEQLPSCSPTFYSSPASSVPSLVSMYAMSIAAVMVIGLAQRMGSGSGLLIPRRASIHGAPSFILAVLFPGLMLAFGAFWWLDWHLQSSGGGLGSLSEAGVDRAKTAIVRFVWLPLCCTAWAVWWSNPASLDVTSRPRENGPSWKLVGSETNTRASGVAWLAIITATLVLFQRGQGAANLLLCFALLLVLGASLDDGLPVSGLLAIVVHHFFFRTGHQAALSTLDWGMGFVGLRHVHYILSPIMVMANFTGPFLLVGAAVPVLAVIRLGEAGVGSQGRARALRATMLHSSLVACISLLSMLSCIVLRRHLMVWKVFAPRFMLAFVATIATDAGCILGLAAVARLMDASNALQDAAEKYKLR